MLFCFWKSRPPCRDKRIFRENTTKQTPQKTHICVLKTSPTCCATYLDQFLTYTWTIFNTFSFLILPCLAEITIFIAFSAKLKIKRQTKKSKETLFVNTPVLTALVKMSGFLHFSFLGFSEFPSYWEMFLTSSQTSKNNKIPKQNKRTTTRQDYAKQKKSNMVIQTRTRQQAEKQKQRNILKLTANKTRTKSKNQKLKLETEIEWTLNKKPLEFQGKQWFS